MKTVRVETFDGKTRTISLEDAIIEFGVDELFEYLQGYCSTAVFFLMKNGDNVYPIEFSDLEA